MAHKTHMVAKVKKPNPKVQASPYSYFGRTHDKGLGELHHVARHAGGTALRRGGLAKGPSAHGLDSWLKRGGGHRASYKD